MWSYKLNIQHVNWVLQPKTANFNSVDFIWAKNWLLSAYCQIFLSTEQILVELWWHVYQNEGNVDQRESYLAEVRRMLNFTVKVSSEEVRRNYESPVFVDVSGCVPDVAHRSKS